MQNLAHNTIGPKTADAINDLIEHSASLKSLNLSCMFPTSKRSKGRACVYCVWIVWIVWIVWVVLLLLPIASAPLTPPRPGPADMKMDNQHLALMKPALEETVSLTHLNLSGNKLDELGGVRCSRVHACVSEGVSE